MSEDAPKYKTILDRFVIIVDSREQTPLDLPEGVRTEVSGLQSGDYSIKGLEHLFSVERKSIADLVGSLTSGRDRFERELHRLRGFHFARLLIIGSRQDIIDGNYRSRATPKSILASLDAFEVRYNVPVVFASDEDAPLLVVRWCHWFAREVRKTAQQLGE